jgi:hypothetical protein
VVHVGGAVLPGVYECVAQVFCGKAVTLLLLLLLLLLL